MFLFVRAARLVLFSIFRFISVFFFAAGPFMHDIFALFVRVLGLRVLGESAENVYATR